MSFILSVLFYLYLSAIVAAHNKHRKVLPYIGSETKHIYKAVSYTHLTLPTKA